MDVVVMSNPLTGDRAKVAVERIGILMPEPTEHRREEEVVTCYILLHSLTHA